jgi:cytochrome c556
MPFISRKHLLTAACVAALGFSATFGYAQVKKGKTRPATTKQLMQGMVKPHGEAIKQALQDAPKDDKGWDALAAHAAVLNEASYVLMEDGRSPDEKWEDATVKYLRAGSEQLLAAIEKHDIGGVKTAFGATMRSCKACHDAHKPKH